MAFKEINFVRKRKNTLLHSIFCAYIFEFKILQRTFYVKMKITKEKKLKDEKENKRNLYSLYIRALMESRTKRNISIHLNLKDKITLNLSEQFAK